MKVKIYPSKTEGEINSPPSKSQAHRAIILASLSGQKCVVENVGNSSDVLATVSCVKSLGANCELIGNDLHVSGFEKKDGVILDCNESGSTLRFLLPVVSALGIKAKFKGSEKLFLRPNEKLIESLNLNGANIKDFSVNGKINNNLFNIDASISSQYLSGLLLSAYFLEGDVTINVVGKTVSKNYIDLTVDLLKTFGAEVTVNGNTFYIKKDKIKSVNNITVEGDYSGSAVWLSAGAIGGSVKVNNLNKNSSQGDKKILDILSAFGAKVIIEQNSVTVLHKELNGITVDVENVIDLAEIIAVIGAFAKGKTVLKNVERLKYKESDRLKAITETLKKANVKYSLNDNSVTVYGGKPKGNNFYTDSDHRTAMALTVLCAYADGVSTIQDASCVKKSYPDFFSDFEKLGGKADVCF